MQLKLHDSPIISNIYSNIMIWIPQFLYSHSVTSLFFSPCGEFWTCASCSGKTPRRQQINEASSSKHSGLVAVWTFRVRFEAGDAGVLCKVLYLM